MPTVPINITGPTYEHRSRAQNTQKTVGLYPEIIDTQVGKSKFILNSWPGLKIFATAQGGKDRGLFEFKGVTYKVTGTTLSTLNQNGEYSAIGTIPGFGRCVFEGIGDNIVIVTGGRVYVYNPTKDDVSLLSYASKSSYIGSQESDPTALRLSSDGTKAYAIGGNGTIYQYALSTAFDVSTAGYADKSFSVLSEETIPLSLAFSDVGDKAYIAGLVNSSIFQYTLSTPWDISTASYDSKSLSLLSEESVPQGIALSDDGMKAYAVGSQGTIYQYALTTTWDISTGSYESKSLSVLDQEQSPKSILFDQNGTLVAIIGAVNDTIYQYTLSTPWDISTGSYASKLLSIASEESNTEKPFDVSTGTYVADKSLDVSSQDTSPTDISFSSDGIKAYIVGDLNNTIYQYALSTAWDISTGTYESKSLSVATQETGPQGLAFSSDGTKAYVVGFSTQTIYQYTLSRAWDISTGSYASKSLSVSSEDTGPTSISFSQDGTKAYIIGITNDTIYQYTLSTAWDISTGSYASKSLSIAALETSPTGLSLSVDGTKAYFVGSVNDTIYQYTLSTAWDISTGSYAAKNLSVIPEDSFPNGLFLSPYGTKAYIIGDTNDTIYQYTFTTQYDISTAYYATNELSVTAQETNPFGLDFSIDGTKAYIVGQTNDTIYQYNLTVPWQISTGSYASKSLSVATQETSPLSVVLSFDGTKAYIIGSINDTIYQYTLSTAWDISTGSYASKSLSVAAQDATPVDLAFSQDGTKAYVVGNTNDTIYQYTLSTAWDISTGSYASKSLSVSSQETSPYGLAFSFDGTKVYTVGINNDTIYQYTLTTAWDISTGSYASKSLSVTSEDLTPTGLALAKDGTKAYIMGSSSDTIYQYKLGDSNPSIHKKDTNIFLLGDVNDTVYQYSTLNEVTDSDLETPNSVSHLNNQVIYDGDGGRFVTSDVGDATSVNGLNYATAESNPDNILRTYVFNQILYLFGEKTIESWYNSGVGSPPFDRIEGGIMPVGLGAIYSTAHNDNFLYFLADDNRVYRISGVSKENISTIGLTGQIESYQAIADAIGYTLNFQNQNFYMLRFPSENKSWCYSESSQQWFEPNEGLYIGNSHVYAFRKNLIADGNNGNIYELDLDTYDENGELVERYRDTGPLHGELFGSPGKRIEMNRFELIMEVGVGRLPSTSDNRENPYIMLSVSDDGGKTFSTERWGQIGKQGQYMKVEWNNLGSFYERVIRVKMSDPNFYSIHSAAADIEVGI